MKQERKFRVRIMGKEKILTESDIEKMKASGFVVEVITQEL